MQSSFTKDLAFGAIFETEVKEYLNMVHEDCTYYHVDGYFTQYDLICDHCNISIECKHDKKSIYTGNFVFEKSLFEKSTATYVAYKHCWVSYDAETHEPIGKASGIIWLFNRLSLVNRAQQYMQKNHRNFIKGGDFINGKQNEMLIVPIELIPIDFVGTYQIIDMTLNRRGIK